MFLLEQKGVTIYKEEVKDVRVSLMTDLEWQEAQWEDLRTGQRLRGSQVRLYKEVCWGNGWGRKMT